MAKTTTIYSATTINSLNQRQMNDTITSLTNDERIISDAYDFINANKTDHQANLINVSNFINEQLKDDLVSKSPYETFSYNLNNIIVNATIYHYDIVTSHKDTIFLSSRLSPKDLKLAPYTQVAKLVKKYGCICTVDGTRIKAKKPVKIKATIDSYLAEQDLELLGDSKQFSSYKFGLGQDLKDLTDETFEAISILYAARSTMTAEKKYTDSVKEELKILQDKIFKINIKFLNKTKKNASKLDKKLEKIISKISKKLLEPTTSKISSQSSYLKSCIRIQDSETFKRDIASSMIYNEMKETESIDDYFELLKSKKEMGV